MLLQPFLGAMLVLRSLTWAVLPALACVILLFLIRQPLIVLARQRWIWRDPHPETVLARKRTAVLATLLAIAGGSLFYAWPWWLIVALGGGAGLLTAIAVVMTIHHRQRAAWFQALSAAGLSSSCLAACLAVTGSVPVWGWWWWALHSAHFLAGILVVHVRLEARILARRGGALASLEYREQRRQAVLMQIAMFAGAILVFWLGKPAYAVAMVLSAGVHLLDLRSAHMPEAVSMPMMRVGRRALAVSIVFTLLMVVGAVF